MNATKAAWQADFRIELPTKHIKK
ncbi:hypothetical protein Rmet_6527 [Cupriavidus metallidurans CH34]|uniref:Uncharacterized protein n=1 Tax=Cupriavidus metallidurans (strain ATCC 43123 / DSM 2839 / NBRC 102507 / CH34) TaxID=266264 RepID=D3DXW4_CUPMC|nr:hypothetical protein Rmet_6527 [Cupriavidus metallidurans CH34]